MPASLLPTYPAETVASHNSAKSCYVTLGANIFDITSFLGDHPGGRDLILKYGGQDVSNIMGNVKSHAHSEVAYEILHENLIGFVKPVERSNIGRHGGLITKFAEGLQAATQDFLTQPFSTPTIVTPQSKPEYCCTLCRCVSPFKNQSDWKKHEREHNTTYVCMLQGPREATPQGAQSCLQGSSKAFPCKRRHEMVNHLSQIHGIHNEVQGKATAMKWKYTVEKQAWSCGFCVNVFVTFNDRLSHIAAQHFERGQTLDEWDATKVIQGLLHQSGMIKAWERKLASLPIGEVSGIIWERDAVIGLQYDLEVGPNDERSAADLAEAAYIARRMNRGMENQRFPILLSSSDNSHKSVGYSHDFPDDPNRNENAGEISRRLASSHSNFDRQNRQSWGRYDSPLAYSDKSCQTWGTDVSFPQESLGPSETKHLSDFPFDSREKDLVDLMWGDDHNEGHRTLEGDDQRRAQLAIGQQTVDDPILCDGMADNSELSEERWVDKETTGGRERMLKRGEDVITGLVTHEAPTVVHLKGCEEAEYKADTHPRQQPAGEERNLTQRISKTGFSLLDYLLQVTPLDDLGRLYEVKIFGLKFCVRVKFLVNYRERLDWQDDFYHLEKPVPKDKARVHWRCHCGRWLYGDFKELCPGAATRLEYSLNASSAARQYISPNQHVKGKAVEKSSVYRPAGITVSRAIDQTPVILDSSTSRFIRTIHTGDFTAGSDPGQANGYDSNERSGAKSESHEPPLGNVFSKPTNHSALGGIYDRAPTGQVSGQGDIQKQGSGLGHWNSAPARQEFSGDRSSSFILHSVQNIPQEASEAPAPASVDNLFLLLCIPHRKYATKLVHMDVCTLLSDRLFFTNLKLHYRSMRGQWASLFSLRQLRSIRFVHFEMYPSTLVDIRKTDDIPPETHKDEYRYRPMPAELIPPIGENHLMHLYDHPEDAEDTAICLDKVPKKFRERLGVCPQRGTGLGWGIHFVEGLHWTKLWILGFVGLLMSNSFGIAWACIRNDVQGGFGIAACMMVGLTFTTGIVQAALGPK